MTTKDSELSKVHLFHYVVASADMYYTEEGQCDVFLEKDESGHIHIWGETSDGDPSARIDLCQVFLEYGLYCSSWCNAAEAHYHMQNFGERLGYGLAKYLRANPVLLAPDDPALCALGLIFESIDADFAEEPIEGGVHFLITHCPVQKASKRSGLLHVELARYGVNAMCRILLLDIDPHLKVEASPEISTELSFRISRAELAY